jgi:hypothetical protein
MPGKLASFLFKSSKPFHLKRSLNNGMVKDSARSLILDFIGNKELVITAKVFLYGQLEGCANYKQSP